MKLLIGYDGSKYSDWILGDLQKAGLPKETEAIVLCVADTLLPPSYGVFGDSPRYLEPRVEVIKKTALRQIDAARHFAEQAARRLKSQFIDWRVHSHARGDSPASALLTKAFEWKPDLVVLGTRGRGTFGPFNLGSVSQRVLSQAGCNVRIARRSRRTGNKTPIRILIGIDGSGHSKKTWEAVLRREWKEGTQVHLLMATQDVRRDRPAARILLEAMVNRLRSKGMVVGWDLRKGDPSRLLIEFARRWKADSIFLGSRGLGPVRRLFLGSVSAAVSTQASCSVEIIKK